MRRVLLFLVVAGCGGSKPATSSPADPAMPSQEPAASSASQGDPSTHRTATVIAATAATAVPASLWRDGDAEGALVTQPGAPGDRIAVALTATGRCDGASTCTFYEHSVPPGQQRADSLAWREYGPDRRFAPVWGNLESGPAGVLVEVKAGSAPFWHMHGRDARIVVLAGTVEFRESGSPPHTLSPGSYVLQPAGYKHTESCAASGPDCVLYLHTDRHFDVKPL